jgi:hypothetical protein
MDKLPLRRLVADFLEYTRTDTPALQDACQTIVGMTFLSPPEEQWEMVLECVRQAQTDQDLDHVAAGPIEGLLGRFGKEVIDRVEKEASVDPKFARTLTGVWRHTMTDDVWARVRAIQRCVSDPLKAYRPDP